MRRDMPAHGVTPMRWQVRASLPFRQRGHACVPNYSASKDASPDGSGMTCASCEATETCGRTGFSQRTQVMWVVG